MADRSERGPRIAFVATRLATGASRLAYLSAHLLSEVPLMVYSPKLADRVAAHYYRGRTELHADEHVLRGLFPYEQEALDRFFPNPPARILVHGAGAGRETLALLQLGYAVDAFEPVLESADEANRRLVARGLSTRVECASVEAWMEGGATGAYDGIITGWAMWTHMMEHAGRLRALEAFRAACPDGPLLLSFFRTEPDIDTSEWGTSLEPLHPTEQGGKHVTRDLVRRRLLGMPPLERGTAWEGGSFVHLVDEPEMQAEATDAGWHLAYYERDATRYGYAVLVPPTKPALMDAP